MSWNDLRHRCEQSGQGHLVQWWDELSPDQHAQLAQQLEELDLAGLSRLHQQTLRVKTSAEESAAAHDSPAEKARRAVPPLFLLRRPQTPADHARDRTLVECGLEVLRQGQVGVILVAGGQGTRLDFPHPKGMFPLGPVSHSSLFQMLAEQLLARAQHAGRSIPYYIMTSDATHEETIDFFEEHEFFGLSPDDVYFFRQGNMPALDWQTGRVLMTARHAINASPDGHGGLLSALQHSGLLDNMRERGLEYLFYHQVDNPLVQVCDPLFLGGHVQHKAQVSVKVVAKLSPEEKMGVVVDCDDRTQIIEYSDLPADVAAQRDERGELRFWAGSTAIHIFSREFFQQLCDDRIDLPFHIARKKIPYLNERGEWVEPTTENAMKFERFIFDVLPLAEKVFVLEADRAREFLPLKNKTGEFSPDHVRQGLMALHRRWLSAAGVPLGDHIPVEISPLYALDPHSLAQRLPRPFPLTNPIHLRP